MLAAFVLAGVAIRVLSVLSTRHIGLAGDEIEYDHEARFILDGHWFWTTVPYGIAHAGIWKAPGYPVWLAGLYEVVGTHLTAVRLVQALLLDSANMVLAWVLARRMFGARAALVAVGVMAVYPLAFMFEGLLYSEGLGTTLTLLVLLAVLERDPTPWRAAGAGVLLAANILVRPSSIFLFAAVAVAWLVAAGWRRGLVLSAVSALALAVVVAPWTARNDRVAHAFIPVSMQDIAAYGTFNDDAANDPIYPYGWRPIVSRDRDLFNPRHPLGDAVLRARLHARVKDYIRAHPSSLPKAFFWNGITRLWDIRRPSHAPGESATTGRSRRWILLGLAFYYVLAPLAVAGLWLARRRRGIVLPVVALVAAASVVQISDAATRYRAPFEPLIVVMAAPALLALAAAAR